MPAAAVPRAFLFADLRDYTAFVEGAGDRAAADLIRSYRELIRGRLRAHDGAEIKTEGDSFYIVFPSATQAISFGVDVLQEASARRTARATPLRFGMGVHAGEAVALDNQFVGSAVNLAARVGAIAGEGELLVTDTVRGLVRTGSPYPLSDRGTVALKGVAEPVRLFAVQWRPDEAMPVPLARPALPPLSTLLSSVFVGRTAELAALERLGEALAQGQGGTVLVPGAAGLGKSRLVREWSERATRTSVLIGGGGATDSRPLYEPFAAMIRQLVRAPTEEARLRGIAPELTALVPDLSGETVRAPDRDRLFGAFLRFAREYARSGPLAIVVEDLHWTDDATLALFRFLALEAAVTPYLLVATYRDDELHRRHQLRPLLVELARRGDVSTIPLHALDVESSRRLLQHVHVDLKLSVAERERIVGLSEGNPLFIEELARSTADRAEALPLTIAEAVLRRFAALDEAARRLVTYAAVAGTQVGFDLLQPLVGMPERDLLRAARQAIDGLLLVEVADGLAFRHALTREVIYRDLMRREQRLLHREVAEALERLRGGDPAAAHEIERQFFEAGLAERALPFALAAGEHALGLLAPAEAVAHFERAVDAAPPASLERAKALEGLGNGYRLQLEVSKAVGTLRDALALYREVGTPADVLRAQMNAARALPFGPQERQAWTDAWSLAQGHAAPAQLFQIADALADRAYQFMDDDAADAWSRTATDLAAKIEGGALARARRTAREIEHPAGWHVEVERDVAEGLDRALERDEGVLVAYRRYLDSRCRDADAAERQALLQRARAYATARAPGVPRAMIFRFGPPWITWLEGDWESALAFWDELQRQFAREDLAEIFPDTGPIGAAIRVEREGPDEAGAALRQAAERQARTGTWRGRLVGAAHLANLQLAKGCPADVVADLASLFAKRSPQALELSTFLLAARVLAPAALLTRDSASVRPWTDAAPALVGEGAMFDAAIAHLRATDAAISGDAAVARSAYAAAQATYERLGWHHLAAELAWQRARAGDESQFGPAREFYLARGAAWRARWLEEGGWR